MKQLNKLILTTMCLLVTACGSKYEPRESIVDAADKAVTKAKEKPLSVRERQAYEAGVKDVLTDMKGKMRARNRFNWEMPIVQCGVSIPARVINGMLIPAHETCVQVAPGQWTEEAPTYLPELGAADREQ